MSVTAQQALADLQAAAASIQTQLTTQATAVAAVQAEITKLAGEIAAGNGVAPADVETVVATLQAQAAALGNTNAALTAAAASGG